MPELLDQSYLIADIKYDDAIDWLSDKLSEHRLYHSIGVYNKAITLAQQFQFPEKTIQQAATAGLLHDAAKLMHPETLLNYAKEYQINLELADEASPQTLHPIIGAVILEKDLGITDKEILNAVRYHTTGRPKMSWTEKIVYIADKTEENTRNPDWIAKVTEHLETNDRQSINRTLMFLLEQAIQSVKAKGLSLHPRTVAAKESLHNEIKHKQT